MSQSESAWNVEVPNERLCTYYYVDSAIHAYCKNNVRLKLEFNHKDIDGDPKKTLCL